MIDLYLKTDDVAMKKAIVSVVASGILACDVMEMVRKIQGGEGEYLDGASCENGCLSHSNSQKIPKILSNTPSEYASLGKNIQKMLYMYNAIELSEAEWLASYTFDLKRRRSKRHVITMLEGG